MTSTTGGQQQRNWSIASTRAIERLKLIKPNDGWSIEFKQSTPLVRLLRRSIPVTDSYFIDIHYDVPSNTIVGILTPPNSITVQAQVLVDSNGKIQQRVAVVSISTYTSNISMKESRSNSSSSNSNNERGSTTTSDNNNNTNMFPDFGFFGTNGTLTDGDKQRMMMYFMYAVFGSILVRVLANAVYGLSLILLPIGFSYLSQNCPTIQSFDVKQQLKRVLRGQHLPENHPSKPQGFFSETIARVTASIATELATLPGYEVITTNVLGTCIVVKVRVPTANLDFYWIGIVQQWYFLYSSEINKNSTPGSNGTGDGIHFSTTRNTSQFQR
jgi:hypothetical protein